MSGREWQEADDAEWQPHSSSVGRPRRTAARQRHGSSSDPGPANQSRRQLRVYCQVDGCEADLSGDRHYLQRYKICDLHSKVPELQHEGVTQRFCQQCSRLHNIHSFEGDKRSCAERLERHNARRRRKAAERKQAMECGEGGGGSARGNGGRRTHFRSVSRSRSRSGKSGDSPPRQRAAAAGHVSAEPQRGSARLAARRVSRVAQPMFQDGSATEEDEEYDDDDISGTNSAPSALGSSTQRRHNEARLSEMAATPASRRQSAPPLLAEELPSIGRGRATSSPTPLLEVSPLDSGWPRGTSPALQHPANAGAARTPPYHGFDPSCAMCQATGGVGHTQHPDALMPPGLRNGWAPLGSSMGSGYGPRMPALPPGARRPELPFIGAAYQSNDATQQPPGSCRRGSPACAAAMEVDHPVSPAAAAATKFKSGGGPAWLPSQPPAINLPALPNDFHSAAAAGFGMHLMPGSAMQQIAAGPAGHVGGLGASCQPMANDSMLGGRFVAPMMSSSMYSTQGSGQPPIGSPNISPNQSGQSSASLIAAGHLSVATDHNTSLASLSDHSGQEGHLQGPAAEVHEIAGYLVQDPKPGDAASSPASLLTSSGLSVSSSLLQPLNPAVDSAPPSSSTLQHAMSQQAALPLIDFGGDKFVPMQQGALPAGAAVHQGGFGGPIGDSMRAQTQPPMSHASFGYFTEMSAPSFGVYANEMH